MLLTGLALLQTWRGAAGFPAFIRWMGGVVSWVGARVSSAWRRTWLAVTWAVRTLQTKLRPPQTIAHAESAEGHGGAFGADAVIAHHKLDPADVATAFANLDVWVGDLYAKAEEAEGRDEVIEAALLAEESRREEGDRGAIQIAQMLALGGLGWAAAGVVVQMIGLLATQAFGSCS